MQFQINLWRFGIVYVLVWLACALLFIALAYIANIEISGSATQIAAALAAAIDAGNQFFKRYHQAPDNNVSWKASLKMTYVEVAISTLVNVLLIIIIVPILNESAPRKVDPLSLFPILAGMLFFLHLCSFVAKKYLFQNTAKGLVKKKVSREQPDT